MGSVKDLKILKEPTDDRMGIGQFNFSDRYSVFDWGQMPDTIPNKGAALCVMGAFFFEQAEKNNGSNTHYRGLITEDGKRIATKELSQPLTTMEVNLVRVLRPTFADGKYDYSIFHPALKNFLVPLETIYRNSLPEGSSVFGRLEKGELKPNDLGLDHYPKPGEILPKVMLDVSTKLEQRDRYISWEEAKIIAGLENNDVHDIKTDLLDSEMMIRNEVEKIGLKNEDGKLEFAYNAAGSLMIVDVMGTLDECRFTYNGFHVCKEVARNFYRPTEWYQKLKNAKEIATQKGIKEWKQFCDVQPPALDPQLKNNISQMYMSVANGLLRTRLFESPKIDEVVKEYQEIANRLKL